MSLSPCPFCGGNDLALKTINVLDEGWRTQYECVRCGAFGPAKVNASVRVASWNDRASAPIGGMTEDDVRAVVNRECLPSWREWCRVAQVNHSHLSEFMSGYRGAPGDLLAALGLGRRIVRIAPDEPESPMAQIARSMREGTFKGASPSVDKIEQRAREIYDGWEALEPGWVPWVVRGNSVMQDKARRAARDEAVMIAAAMEPRS